jgi:ABC-type branched-subunit amino acid transport system permease subunit
MTWVNVVVQGVLLGGLYALFACGLSLLFGVMRVINLAHGDLAVLAAYLAVTLVPAMGLPAGWSIVIVLPIFAVFGYLLQRSLVQASVDRGPLTTLLVTFGLSVIIENALLAGFSADSHSISVGSLASRSIRISDQLSIGVLSLVIFAVAVVVLLSLQYLLSRTGTGRLIRAVADDREAARLAGVNHRHVFGVAAAIAFATVAVAGLAFGMYSSFAPASGASRLLFAFEAVVIGGLGSLWGTLLGGMVLGVAQAIGAQIDPADAVLAGHAVFLAVLAFRPEGLTGRRSATTGPWWRRPGVQLADALHAATRPLTQAARQAAATRRAAVAARAAATGPDPATGAPGMGLPLPSVRVTRSRRSLGWLGLGAIAIVAVLAYLPYLVYSGTTDTLVNAFILVTLASMWNLLAGYAGQVSVGQQAFIGLGAYLVLIFAQHGLNPFTAIGVAAIGCAVIALPVSWLVFRLRGGYFAIATWVVADACQLVISRFSSLGGGTGKALPGLTGIDPTLLTAATYWAALAITVLTLGGVYLLLRSRLGLALTAVRDNEVGARSLGVRVARTQRVVYLVAALGCGAAGAVLVISQLNVEPTAAFTVQWSAEMIFVTVIGGIGTIEGPIVGTVVFIVLQQSLSQYGSWYLIVLGSVAVVVAIWFPRGLWGLVADRLQLRLFPVGYWLWPTTPDGTRMHAAGLRTSE